MQEVAKETRRFIFCGKLSSATPRVTKKKKRNRNKTKTILLKTNFKLELIPFGYPIKDKLSLLYKGLRKLSTVNYRLQAPPFISPPPRPQL